MRNAVLATGLLIGLAVVLPMSVHGANEKVGDSANATGGVVVVAVTSRRTDDSAFPIAARVGDQFTITLDSNHTTGYQWQLAASPDVKMVQFVLNTYNEPSKPIPGRGGTETWTFRAAGKGKTAIAFNYVRPWEKDKPPARTQRFGVEVR